jgi:polysaccharide biosynthesis/export protein
MKMSPMLRRTLLLAVAYLLSIPLQSSAQTPPPPGTPPAQIQQQIDGLRMRGELQSRITASGMSADQIRRRLASMGYDPRTLDPYLTNDDSTPPDPAPNAVSAARALGLLLMDDVDVEDLRPEPASLTDEERRLEVRVFGMEVFSRGSSEFDPVSSGAVPGNYVLGPGDELVLVLTGDVEMIHQLPVTREGFILIPQVGQVWVNGLTMQGLREQLYNRLGRVYSGVRRGAGSTTHFDVSLARLRSNQIYISGEVMRPGAYTVSPLASVLNALYQAGGPTPNGSFREVHVMRGGNVAHRVDLYEYLLRGDNLDRVRLEPGDVVFVPVRGEHVSIRGEVTRPGIFELRRGETLRDLLAFAGGFTTPAHISRARLTRVLPPSRRTVPGVDRVVMDVDLSEAIRDAAAAPHLESGDDITVLAVRDEVRNMVSLNGSVWRPGSYEYRSGMQAWDLINAGQGLNPEAFISRAHITRLNPEDGSLSLVPFSLERNADGSPVSNPALEEYDVVTIYSRNGRDEDLTVLVSGAVREPTEFPYKDGMTLRDAIVAAGGLTRTADPVVEVARVAGPESRAGGQIAHIMRVTLDPSYFVADEAARHYAGDRSALQPTPGIHNASDFVLQPLDRIFVRQIPDYDPGRVVRVAGEVRYPGTYSLRHRDERLRDVLLERAGGLSATAHAAGFQMYRNDRLIDVNLPGVLARSDHRDNLVLMPGDSLIVPEYNPVVVVMGAVNSPTSVLYRRGASLDYYIASAGGYARNADKGRVHVRFANGSGAVKGRRMGLFATSPTPEPGSSVTVPYVMPEDRVDVRGIVTDAVQIVGSIATVILVVSRLR